jgi:hypothetical protein
MLNKKDEDLLNALKTVIDNNVFKDMTTAIKTNGKSKQVEDFNILDEYFSRFAEAPSLLKITHEDCDLFLYEKLKKILKEEFKNSKILFSEGAYDLKKERYTTSREVWYIDEGYLLNIWTSESKDIYSNPELDIKQNKYDQLIEANTILIPSANSVLVNKKIEEKIIKSFKTTTIKEYERNMIGMMSIESSGELYVKDFSLDKKFKINDLDLHYGENFKQFHNDLFKKLKSDKKGLILLHGAPGTGKCVHGKTKVTIRDKKTGEIKEMNIEDLM